MNVIISMLFQMLTPLLFVMFIVALGVIITSRFFHRSAEYISLWLPLAMICLVGHQASIAYQQFQATERPNIGINLESINFLKNGQGFEDIININGKIPSKFLSPVIIITNYGEKPGFVETVLIDFKHGNEHLLLTSSDWENLPLYPEEKMELTIERPISKDDFKRVGFAQHEVTVSATATYRNMSSLGEKYKIVADYKYQAADEKLYLFSSEFSSKYDIVDSLKSVLKKYVRRKAVPIKPAVVGLLLQLLGTMFLIFRPALKYFRGYILRNQAVKKDIEDEAIATTFNRLANKDRSINLSDSLARGFITTYKGTFWGFIFIVAGSLIQTLAG